MRSKIKTERAPRAKSQRPPSALESLHFAEIRDLAAAVNQLHHQMADQWAPMVQDLIQSRNRDQQQIEHTLDYLLDCACIPEGLTLFRSLCRYYYTLNPVAAASYVGAYREMWDSDDEGKDTP